MFIIRRATEAVKMQMRNRQKGPSVRPRGGAGGDLSVDGPRVERRNLRKAVRFEAAVG